jgi:predicted transcriptional regulator
MLRIEQRDLAERSGVSLETIKRIERTPGEVSAYASTVSAIQRALEAAGVEFINGDKPGVRISSKVAAVKAKPKAKAVAKQRAPQSKGRSTICCFSQPCSIG